MNSIQKKDEMAILISEKVDFKAKNIAEDKTGHNNNRANVSRGRSNPKYISTRYKTWAGGKAKTGTTPKKNRQMYSISGDFNILFSINDRTGNQKG